MDQHFLPRSYLKCFVDPESEDSREPYVWIRKIGDGRWRKRAPKKVATKPDYYSIILADGTVNHDLEHWFSQLEDAYIRVLRESIMPQKPLSNEDRALVALYVTMFMQRLPTTHAEVQSDLKEQTESYVTTEVKRLASNPSQWAQIRSELRRIDGKPVPATLSVREYLEEQTAVYHSRPLAIRMAVAAGVDGANTLAGMGWTIIHSVSPDFFITSDSPVRKISAAFEEGRTHDPQRDLIVSFPFTRTIALWATSGHSTTRVRPDAPAHLVMGVNQRTAMEAKSLLVAPKPEFPGVETIGFND